LEFEFFDLLLQGFEVFLYLFKKDFPALFVQNSQRLLQIGQFALYALKWGYSSFKSGFFLEKLFCFIRRRPDLFFRQVPADLCYVFFFPADIKDNPGALRFWPSTRPSLP
jgi:hypothetical protein